MARRTPPSRLLGSGLIPQSFQDEANNTENDYTTGLAGLGKQQSSLFQDYGFQGGINEQGGVDFQTDGNNRFGKYQQLIQSIGAQLAAARQETSGRGIGKRGLAKARESLIRDMSAGDKSSLVNNFSKGAADIFGRRGQALTTRNRGFGDTEGRALDWWNQNGPEDFNAEIDAGSAGPAGPAELGGGAGFAGIPGAGATTGQEDPAYPAQILGSRYSGPQDEAAGLVPYPQTAGGGQPGAPAASLAGPQLGGLGPAYAASRPQYLPSIARATQPRPPAKPKPVTLQRRF